MNRVAAIDIGTNTVRLLVCTDVLEYIEHGQRITRLGKGVDATGSLDPASIAATGEAVASFVERARELGAQQIRVAGTSALRDARNSEALLSAVRDATGLDVEILDGETEGRCAYNGATSWLPAGAYVACDIGGGSTEIITAKRTVSVDVGSVRVKERFFTSDPPRSGDVEVARAFVRDLIGSNVVRMSREQLVGVAGTVTTLAALVLGLKAYDSDKVHGSRIARSQVDELSGRLLTMPSSEIAGMGPVHAGRADVIGSGSLILSVVMGVLGAPDVLVSERDILDGLVADLVR